MPSLSEPFLAWRFANPDGTSTFQKTPQAVGELYTLPHREGASPGAWLWQSPRVGQWGFHASPVPLIALYHGNRCSVERVRLSGDIDSDQIDQNDTEVNAAASQRTTLWRADAAQVLLSFAADCAERALETVSGSEQAKQWESIQIPDALDGWATWDTSARRAVAAARGYVNGELSADEDELRRAFTAAMNSRPRDLPKAAFLASGAAIHAVGACFYHATKPAQTDGVAVSILDCCRRCCEIARATPSRAEGRMPIRPYEKQRDWQNSTLHARLMALAPTSHTCEGAGYTESTETKSEVKHD